MYVYVFVVCACVRMQCVCSVSPMDPRRGCQMPWSWSSRCSYSYSMGAGVQSLVPVVEQVLLITELSLPRIFLDYFTSLFEIIFGNSLIMLSLDPQ